MAEDMNKAAADRRRWAMERNAGRDALTSVLLGAISRCGRLAGMCTARVSLRGHWVAAGICLVRLALGVVYSVTVPVWEAYDEDGHYQYVRYVAATGALPQEGDPTAEEIWEKFQPPLYYVLGAAATRWIETIDDMSLAENPFFASGTGGVNHWIHSQSEEFPYRGMALAVHVVRLLSVGLSLVGVACTYAIGLMIARDSRRIALCAMSIHAFWPQFLFNGSVVTNDVLASALGSLITLTLVGIVVQRNGGVRVLVLGGLLALGLLTKINTVALLPIAVYVAINEGISKYRGSPRSAWLRWSCFAVAGCIPVVVASLMLARMSHLAIPVVWEGDGGLFSEGVVPGVAHLAQSMDFALLREAVPYAFWSFFALFGWGNVQVDLTLYSVYAVLVVVALSGLWLFWIRGRSRVSRRAVRLLQWVWLAVVALPLLWAMHEGRPYLAPGRYMLPGMSAVSLLLCLGWEEAGWSGRRRLPLAETVAAAIGVLALVIPFRYIVPAYAHPPLASVADLEAVEHRVSFRFGERLELLGYELARDRIEPREAVEISIYWRALMDMQENYAVCVRLVGPNGDTDGADCTYPGRGNYATSLWKAGDIVRDRYYAGVRRDFPTPSFAHIDVAVFQYPEEKYLSVVDSGGHPISRSARFGAVKVASDEDFSPQITNPVSYNLGDVAGLAGYELGGSWSARTVSRVKLYWKPLSRTDKDYTVFVHVVDAEGQVTAQHDGQPRNGTYPTSLWEEGEIIEDEHELALPRNMASGPYEIRVGMYSLDTMQRLAVTDYQAERQVGDYIVLRPEAIAP